MLPPISSKVDFAQVQESFLSSLGSGQLMVSLFESIPGAFYFVKDSTFRFMGGSDRFARMFGEDSMARMIGRTDYDFCPDFLADSFHQDDVEVLSKGIEVKDKVELVPFADGSLDWLCTNKIPLYNSDGDILGLAGVTRLIRDEDTVYADHPEMGKIVEFAKTHYRGKVSVATMAEQAGISVSTQERLFKKTFGITPLMYLRWVRLSAACLMLRESDEGLAAVARSCGFSDHANMTRAFRSELRIVPNEYRRRFVDTKKNGQSYRTRSLQFLA